MAYTRAQAGKLLNASESGLLAASRANALKALTTTRLRAKVKRARALRDKFRDLFKRQKLATRARTGSKLGADGVANLRTRQKAEIFTEMLQRFEKRLAQVEVAEARAASAAVQARAALSRKRRAGAATAAARQPGTRSKPRARPADRLAKGPRPTTESARSARHAMHFNIAGQQAIRGHVSARGRRNQAKHDKRR